MNADDMKAYICATFDGLTVMDASDDTFFIYDPAGDLPAERQMPFATIVTGDHYDTVADLGRAGVYRLNLGLTKATYGSLLGPAPTLRDEHGILQTGADYAAVDTLLPHPFYASQYWVCVLNPDKATLDTVRELLREAHGYAARKYANRQSRRTA